MNVAFVGSLDRGFAVIEWCKKNDASLDNFNDKKIEKLVDPLLSRPYQHIILDIEHLVTPYPEIAETVGKIKAASNVSITILASGYSPNSDVVTALLNIGIRNFVTATSLGEMTDQLEKCLAGGLSHHARKASIGSVWSRLTASDYSGFLRQYVPDRHHYPGTPGGKVFVFT